MIYIEQAIKEAVEKKCEICKKSFTKNPQYSKKQWARAKYCSFRCGGKAAALRQGFRIGNIPANKGCITVRQCSDCSMIDASVSFYARWQKLLCEKHYYHYKKYGRALWSDKRPYKTPIDRRERGLEGVGLAWRKAIFARDDYTCQICGERGGKLEADHIKPFRFFPDIRWELSNGRTLCVQCHRKTPTYGRRLDHLASGNNAESFFAQFYK